MNEDRYNEAALETPNGDRVTLRPAAPGDLAPVRALLASVRLPVEDAFDAAFGGSGGVGAGYVVGVTGEGVIVAVAGVEVYEGSGLLRSVAVRADCQGSAIGRALALDRIAWARARGLAALYLLTETAPGFFERLGFDRVGRDAIPPAVRTSSEFAHVCPESAVAMVLDLS